MSFIVVFAALVNGRSPIIALVRPPPPAASAAGHSEAQGQGRLPRHDTEAGHATEVSATVAMQVSVVTVGSQRQQPENQSKCISPSVFQMPKKSQRVEWSLYLQCYIYFCLISMRHGWRFLIFNDA